MCRVYETDGARAIVLSGGYKDDTDHGSTMWYTGQGGQKNKQQVCSVCVSLCAYLYMCVCVLRDNLGLKRNTQTGIAMINFSLLLLPHRLTFCISLTVSEVEDQEWVRDNLGLKRNAQTGTPVRVFRGSRDSNGDTRYTYEGLYAVKDAKRVVSECVYVCVFGWWIVTLDLLNTQASFQTHLQKSMDGFLSYPLSEWLQHMHTQPHSFAASPFFTTCRNPWMAPSSAASCWTAYPTDIALLLRGCVF